MARCFTRLSGFVWEFWVKVTGLFQPPMNQTVAGSQNNWYIALMHCHVAYDKVVYQILPRRLRFIIIACMRTYNFVFINLWDGIYEIYISRECILSRIAVCVKQKAKMRPLRLVTFAFPRRFAFRWIWGAHTFKRVVGFSLWTPPYFFIFPEKPLYQKITAHLS